MNLRHSLCTSLFLLSATACGGGATPEAASPQGATDEATDGEEAAADEGTDDFGEAEETMLEEEPAAEAESGPSGPSAGRTPKDILGGEGNRFVLSFTSSDIGMKAEERCDSKHGSDPRKRNGCMKTARGEIKEDVLQFKEDPTGRWVWTTSRQKGNTLSSLKKLNFTWGEETKNSVEIIPSKGSKVTISVPNDYSIVLQDPKHGKLTYDTKISE